MSKFKVGDKVKRVQGHALYSIFETNHDAVFTVKDVSEIEGITLVECTEGSWYDDRNFQLYQEPTQIAFNPKPGDLLVTEGEGNWVCCTLEELNKLKKINFHTAKPIVGYRMSGERIGGHQDWDEYGNADGFSELSIKEIIPASTNNPVAVPQQPQDLSFQVKALELENQMLRKLLRREGVEV